MESPMPPKQMCARCATIDIDAVLCSKPSRRAVTLLQNFGLVGTRQMNSSCPLCRLIAAAKDSLDKTSEADQWALCSIPPLHHSWDRSGSYVQLGVLRMSDFEDVICLDITDRLRSRIVYLASITPLQSTSNLKTTKGRLISPHRVNYTVIKSWLQHCQTQHEVCCQRQRSRQPDFLNLINCASRTLEPASTPCPYLALSYVWGQVASETVPRPSNGDLPSVLSKTVEDAITVTIALGYKYLWVDKYCINQDDSQNKMDQIRHMDLVYQNAELTIVASAGLNSEAGLPGVSSIQRSHQPQGQIGNHFLVSLMSDPKVTIKESIWNSRGWTYQEALLSHRLLIFTQQQVYLECQSANYSETLDGMPDMPHSNIFYNEDKRHRLPWNVMNRLAEYVERTLTYEADALNAFLGILKTYERIQHPVYHHWGVPILPPVIQGRLGEPELIQRSRSDGFIAGLCWRQVAPGRRRVGFPTWSWTGWDVRLNALAKEYNRGLGTKGQSNMEVYLEDQDGCLLPTEVICRSVAKHTTLSHHVHILAYTVAITLQHDTREADQGRHCNVASAHTYWAIFDADEQSTVRAELYVLEESVEALDLHSDLMRKNLIGIVLGESRNIGPDTEVFVMVVRDTGGSFERVGHLVIGVWHVQIVNKLSGQTKWRDPNAKDFEACFAHQAKQWLRIG